MAYKLYYGSNALFDPTTDNVVYDAKMTAKTNTSDYLDFTVPYGHDLYSSLAVKAETVKLYWDKDCLYVGTIESVETDLEGNLSVTCTGALDWLADTVVRPYSTIEGKYELTAPSSVDGLFDWYVNQHNQHCMDSKKHFSVGVNQGALLDENNYIYRASGQLPTTLDEIKSKIIDNLGGYLFVRYEPLTVDLYADVYQKNAQIIDFGVNITDFSSVTDSEDQYTAIRPEGATPNKEEGEEDDPSPITIESLPDGEVGGYPDLWKAGDVVYSVSGAARYGYREYAYTNNDCETQDGLLISACKKLNSLLSPQLSITVKAVDLALFMDGYTHLKVGEAVRVRSKFHGVDEYLMVQSIELDLQDPSQSTYELGAEYSTLTGQQSSYLKSLNSGINSALDATSALSSETKAAAKDAQEAKNEASEAKTAADKAVVSTNVEYVQSDSATDVPGTGWSTTPPAWVDGKYIWMRYVITYGNGTVETTEGVVLTGNTGAQGIQGIQGPQGEQGIQGPKGEDGDSTYFHIKYAPVENPTAAQMTETPDVYIGTYVDATQEDSTDPASYTWARFQGLQGEKGDQGIPGVGEDGKTSYLHIKYSDDGVAFTGNDGEDPGNYIGQYTDFTQADSKTFSDYTWSLIKGSDGEDGTDGKDGKSPTATVTKSGDTATITVNNTDGTKTTAQVTDGTDGKDGKSPTATVTKSGTTSTITVNNTDGTTTSVKVLDGSDGKDGEDGTDGKDGKMLYGTCTTAGDTVAKIATVTGFTLTAGTTVSIKFTYANSAEAPTLNINSLGAKPILTNGTTYAYWAAGASVIFAYDGTRFQVCSTPVYADTVTVGNPAGQNVYIDSDSVDIRSGTEVRSSFSGNNIQLGTGTEATISLCGGRATMGIDNYDIFSISAPSFMRVISQYQLNDVAVSGGIDTQSFPMPTTTGSSSDLVGQTQLYSVSSVDGGDTEYWAGITAYTNATSSGGTAKLSISAGDLSGELNDWVVAQGTSGIWTYRKWASGFVELFGVASVSFSSWSSWGSILASNVNFQFDYPFTLNPYYEDGFFVLPNGNYQMGVVSTWHDKDMKTKTKDYYALRPSGGSTGDCTLYIHVIGKIES